jgi:hypothetical protein
VRFSNGVLLCALGVAACDDGYRVRWTRVADLPEGARLGPRSVRLPIETTIAARPTVVSDDGELGCEPQIDSEDPDTLFVEPSERGAYVFIGVTPGETALRLSCGEVAFYLAGSVTEAGGS